MKGRKPLPKKVIELKGGTAHTHRKKKKTSSDPPQTSHVPPSEIFTCPNLLDEMGKREWGRIIKLLNERGIINRLDRSVLAAYCEAYSQWRKTTLQINKDGLVYYYGLELDEKRRIVKSGFPKAHPLIKIQNDAYKRMIKTGDLLGLNPSSRKSLGVEDTKPREKDPYEEFLARKAKN